MSDNINFRKEWKVDENNDRSDDDMKTKSSILRRYRIPILPQM